MTAKLLKKQKYIEKVIMRIIRNNTECREFGTQRTEVQ